MLRSPRAPGRETSACGGDARRGPEGREEPLDERRAERERKRREKADEEFARRLAEDPGRVVIDVEQIDRDEQLARRLSSLPDEHHIDRVATALLDDDSFLGDEVTLDDDWSGNDEDSSWTGLTHSSLNTAEAEANPDLVANATST